MLLSDRDIRAAVTTGLRVYPRDGAGREHAQVARLRLDGFREDHLNPASYDLTLSPVLRVPAHDVYGAEVAPRHAELDVGRVDPGYTVRTVMPEDGWVLGPGRFVLAATREVLGFPSCLAARVEGKSSHGRVGLAVHITAGFIDPGFVGSITLEMANMLGRPIRLRPGMRVAQLALTPMWSLPERPYGHVGHYQDQAASSPEPVESRFSMEGR